jgi:hypothetical protein
VSRYGPERFLLACPARFYYRWDCPIPKGSVRREVASQKVGSILVPLNKKSFRTKYEKSKSYLRNGWPSPGADTLLARGLWTRKMHAAFSDVVVFVRDTGMRNKKELFCARIEDIDWNNRVLFTDQHGTVREVFSRAGESRWFPPFKHKVEDLGDSCSDALYVGIKRQGPASRTSLKGSDIDARTAKILNAYLLASTRH